MTSIATFGYGLTVRGTGLITAARAWPALEPTFRFLDLLAFRRKNDTLFVNGAGWRGKGQIAKVPTEIWEEIRKIIVNEKLTAVEIDVLEENMTVCNEADCTACMPSRPDTWEEVRKAHKDPLNEYEFDSLDDYLWRYVEGKVSDLEPVHQLLNSFGLAHPLTRFFPIDPTETFDIDCIAFIALPSRTSLGHHSTISGEDRKGGHQQHTIVDVSLELPPNPDSRFIRFIRLFNLEVVSSSISTLSPSFRAGTDKKEKNLLQEKEEIAPLEGLMGLNKTIVQEIKPGWKLYTSCHVGEG